MHLSISPDFQNIMRAGALQSMSESDSNSVNMVSAQSVRAPGKEKSVSFRADAAREAAVVGDPSAVQPIIGRGEEIRRRIPGAPQEIAKPAFHVRKSWAADVVVTLLQSRLARSLSGTFQTRMDGILISLTRRANCIVVGGPYVHVLGRNTGGEREVIRGTGVEATGLVGLVHASGCNSGV